MRRTRLRDAGFDDAGWPAAAQGDDIVMPEARTSPFVRRIEELPVREVITTPSGRDGARLRAEPRRPAAASASRARPAPMVTLRHAEVLEHGELGTRPLRAAEATDRYTLAGDGRRGVGARVHVPRLPLRGGRRVAGRVRPGRRDRGRDPQRHGAHRLVRDVASARHAAAREHRVGTPRQLPLPADRLPAARRATGLDGRHPGVRADGVASSTTCAASSTPGCATSRSSRSTPTASCPFVVPERARRRRAPPRRGATRRPSCRGCSTSASATSTRSSASTRA